MSFLDQSKQKTKKIVINNLRKSVMAGIPGINSPTNNQSSQQPQIAESLTITPQVNPAANSGTSQNKQLARLNEQLTYYREKHDQSLIKVRFLADKLESYGGLNSIPDSIVNQISQTDSKIKNLEEMLYFKRSKQMKKLKKKILKFVQMIEFQISEEDLNKIDDQIEIIFFLMDIFTEKYNHLMTEKSQIDTIIESLKQDTVFNRQKLEQQNKYLKQKLTEQVEYVRDLEIQIFNLKRQNLSFGKTNFNVETLLRNQSHSSSTYNQKNSKIYEESINALQVQNQDLIMKSKRSEQTIKNNEYEIITLKREVQEHKILLEKERSKNRELEEQLIKVQREEVRWRERYQLMQRQKNQRIDLLQKQKKAMEGMNNSYSSFQKKGSPTNNPPISLSEKRGYINLKNKKAVDRYEIADEIIEDSGEEYYDVSAV